MTHAGPAIQEDAVKSEETYTYPYLSVIKNLYGYELSCTTLLGLFATMTVVLYGAIFSNMPNVFKIKINYTLISTISLSVFFPGVLLVIRVTLFCLMENVSLSVSTLTLKKSKDLYIIVWLVELVSYPAV